MAADTEQPKPLAVTVAQAQKIVGLSHSTIYELLSEKRLEGVRIGRRRLILYASIEKLIASAQQDAAA